MVTMYLRFSENFICIMQFILTTAFWDNIIIPKLHTGKTRLGEFKLYFLSFS